MSNTAFMAQWTILDLRNGIKVGQTDELTFTQNKEPMSEKAVEFGADCVEAVAAGLVKGVCPLP